MLEPFLEVSFINSSVWHPQSTLSQNFEILVFDLRSKSIDQILQEVTLIVHSAFSSEDSFSLTNSVDPTPLINVSIGPNILPLKTLKQAQKDSKSTAKHSK